MAAEYWIGPASAPDTFGLVSMLGGGGEGEVWRAVLPLSETGRRSVAVKIMRATGDPDEARRWEHHGHLLRSLGHPGLVRVTDVFAGAGMHRAGEPGLGDFRYVVMDYVEGTPLAEWVIENPDTTAGQRLRMLRMIAAALDDMHAGASTEVPVAHGDVKPGNIVIGPDQTAVLVDLGLTRLADGAGVAGHSAPYAAPELRGAAALPTPESDRYAFAVTTAQVLTGAPPPLGPDGWLDPAGLEEQLKQHPLTQRRHMLVQQILSMIAAPPEARPRSLRLWLDGAVESLSQITGPAHAPQAPATVVPHRGDDPRNVPTFVPGADSPPDHPDPRGEQAAQPQPVTSRAHRRGRTMLAVAVVAAFLAAGAVAVWPQLAAARTVSDGKAAVTSSPAPSPSLTPTLAATSPAGAAAPVGGGGVLAAPVRGPGLKGSIGGPTGPGTGPPPPGDPSDSPPPQLQILTTSLLPATVGKPWSVHLIVTGGTPRYSWELGGGALPEGIDLQSAGTLAGTPVVAGKTTFTVEVTDAAGGHDTQQLTLTVNPPSTQHIIGDINGDGRVDCSDKDILLSQYGQSGPDLSGDLNHDRTVNLTDMSILLSHWTGGSSTC
jgi:serine/threonine protein kinase